jgi:hypothetical protein
MRDPVHLPLLTKTNPAVRFGGSNLILAGNVAFGLLRRVGAVGQFDWSSTLVVRPDRSKNALHGGPTACYVAATLKKRPAKHPATTLCLFIPHPSAPAGRRTCNRKGVGPREIFSGASRRPFERTKFHFSFVFELTERESDPEEGNTREIGNFNDAAIHGQESDLR